MGVVHVKPVGVEVDTEKPTGPVKPFKEPTVIVDEPELPARIAEGVTAPPSIVKSGAAIT